MIRVVALLVLGGGLVNLASLIHPLWTRKRIVQELFPLEFLDVARLLTLLIGFALVFVSINLLRRKRRALRAALVLGGLGIVLHVIRHRDLIQVGYSVLVVVALLLERRHFTVKSGPPAIGASLVRIGLAGALGMVFGVAGFWLLDLRDFGINFTFPDALRKSLEVLLLFRDPGIVPRTAHARHFLDSIQLMSWTMLAYSVSALFRPVAYRVFTAPHERRLAQRIVETHGRSAMDYFKTWPDKSLFFSPSGQGVLAYRVGQGFAIVLADPVGPEHEIEPLVRGFQAFCQENDWGLAFHQTLPDFLPLYRRLGFRKLKIGDDAVVDLPAFTLEGRAMKRLRNTVRKLEGQGLAAVRVEAPLPDRVLAEARDVSDEWLALPGRRERRFTLGRFEADYVRGTTLTYVADRHGRMQAFVNVLPSFAAGETTIDLMRHRIDAPGGAMDLLLVRLIERSRALGFQRFNLGMAPLGGFQEGEEATPEERAVHFFIARLHARFNFLGLRQFKAKFATRWEPRYLVYRRIVELPRIAAALNDVSELG